MRGNLVYSKRVDKYERGEKEWMEEPDSIKWIHDGCSVLIDNPGSWNDQNQTDTWMHPKGMNGWKQKIYELMVKYILDELLDRCIMGGQTERLDSDIGTPKGIGWNGY